VLSYCHRNKKVAVLWLFCFYLPEKLVLNGCYWSAILEKTHLSLSFYFLAVLEFELRASHLLGKCSTTSTMPPALSSLDYFTYRVSCFLHRAGFRAWFSYLCFLDSLDHRHTPCFEMGLINSLPVLASNHDSPNLYLHSSWNFRHEPLCLAAFSSFLILSLSLCGLYIRLSLHIGHFNRSTILWTWVGVELWNWGMGGYNLFWSPCYFPFLGGVLSQLRF
jgi:hypothetical protein